MSLEEEKLYVPTKESDGDSGALGKKFALSYDEDCWIVDFDLVEISTASMNSYEWNLSIH